MPGPRAPAVVTGSQAEEGASATMCYMADHPHPSRVGVRQLRQNLSVYLDRVRAGERFEVTDRGHPVAVLIPLPKPSTALQRLIATGRAAAPEGDLLDLPMPGGRPSTKVSDALAEQREERP
jgi:prevent-host-death family protein